VARAPFVLLLGHGGLLDTSAEVDEEGIGLIALFHYFFLLFLMMMRRLVQRFYVVVM
jgi:hypothetical protein